MGAGTNAIQARWVRPSRSISTALAMRRRRVSALLASSIQVTYSRWVRRNSHLSGGGVEFDFDVDLVAGGDTGARAVLRVQG